MDIVHEYFNQTKRKLLVVQSHREKDLKQTLSHDKHLVLDGFVRRSINLQIFAEISRYFEVQNSATCINYNYVNEMGMLFRNLY